MTPALTVLPRKEFVAHALVVLGRHGRRDVRDRLFFDHRAAPGSEG